MVDSARFDGVDNDDEDSALTNKGNSAAVRSTFSNIIARLERFTSLR